jgi:hypothetical protein
MCFDTGSACVAITAATCGTVVKAGLTDDDC